MSQPECLAPGDRTGVGGATGGRFLSYLQQGWLGAPQWVFKGGTSPLQQGKVSHCQGIRAESVTWRLGLVETEGWMRGSRVHDL